MFKKIIVCLLIAIMSITVLPQMNMEHAQAKAKKLTIKETGFWKTNNGKVIKIVFISVMLLIVSFGSLFFMTNAFALTENEAEEYLENKMVRDPSQTIQMVVQSDNSESLAIDIMYNMALVHQNDEEKTSRDYAYWELFGTYDRLDDKIIKNPFGKDFHIVTYSERKNAQVSVEDEQNFNKAVSDVISGWDLKGKTDLEKVEMVYAYITENFEYDYDALENDQKGEGPAFTGAGTMKNKKGVCLGLSLVFKNFCNQLGIPSYLVTDSGETPIDAGHIYPMAKVGKYWTYFDPTWDIGLEKDEWQYFNNKENIDHDIDEEYQEDVFVESHPTAPKK